MSRRGRPRLRTLTLLLVVGAPMAGALTAALVLPWVVGPGLAVRSSADLLAPLPGVLSDETPAGNSVVLAADGSPITWFYRHNRVPVPADRIAPVMQQAVVDIEDSRFHGHRGLDLEGTARALLRNVLAGAVVEGGSTITQQLVKQTLLQSAVTPAERLAATEESLGRKLREARLALALEEQYSKTEILTRYLNTVYFGQGAYGVQAAAQRYFSVDAAALDLGQAAMLAGLVQTPANDDPIASPDAAFARRNQVLARMHVLGHLTDEQLAEISAQPVPVAPSEPPPNGCANALIAGFFCDYVQQHLTSALGIPQDMLDNAGLTIHTTLRPDLQMSADRSVAADLALDDPLAAMFTAVQPGTGDILAMSVNRVFGPDRNDPTQESVNLNVAASQGAGSTYKVFVAAAALERGFPAWHTITTGDPYVSRVYKNGGAPYVVHNAGRYPATLTMAEALIRSSNTYFVALEDQLGSVEGPVRTAQRMGLFSLDPVADQVIAENRGSFTLGAEATSPLALASAYSTLAANGTQCDPRAVTAVLDRSGAPLAGADAGPLPTGTVCTPEAVRPPVATTLNQILVGDTALPIGTGTRAAVPGHQVAGKTGTSQQRFSVAFVGYTPQYAASVMLLDPKRNQDLGGYGGRLAAPIWRDAMLPILSAQAAVPFPPAGLPLDPPRPPSPPPRQQPPPSPPQPSPQEPSPQEPPPQQPPPQEAPPQPAQPPPQEPPPQPGQPPPIAVPTVPAGTSTGRPCRELVPGPRPPLRPGAPGPSYRFRSRPPPAPRRAA